MIKSLRSENGNTLLLVMGFLVVISLIVVPLVMNTGIGLLQSKTGGTSEQAFAKANAAMTVFAGMYNDLKIKKPKYQKQDVQKLYEKFSADIAPRLGASATLKSSADGDPVAVIFASQSGQGRLSRDRAIRYNLDAMPPVIVPPIDPEPKPPIDPIDGDSRVIISNADYNRIFCGCKDQPINIINGMKPEDFDKRFKDYADYYLTTLFNAKTTRKWADATVIPNKVTETNVKQITATGKGLSYAGAVEVKGTETNTALTISAYEPGTALKTAGNLSFSDPISNRTVIDGKVLVGGDLNIREVRRGGSLTFNHDVYVRGNMITGYNGHVEDVTVNGDLVINGDLNTQNSFGKLTVKGDLIVKGKVMASNVISMLRVHGNVLVNGEVNFANNFTIQVDKDMIMNQKLTFGNQVLGMNLGGSLVSRGDIKFTNSSTLATVIGKDVITMGNFNVGNLDGPFQMGGSFLVFGNASFNYLQRSNVNDYQMNGFYVRGITTFPDNYRQDWFKEKKICIIPLPT